MKAKTTRNNSTKKILIIILALVIGSFIGYRFALAQSGNALKSVVEPGSMTSEASYIVFTDGTNYYARNGTTGEIEFSSTNASQVIQSAINALTINKGGKILIKSGTYEITSTILIDNSFVTLAGEGWSTVLKLANNANTEIVRLGDGNSWTQGATITNLNFYGNEDNNPTGGTGIRNYGMVNVIITGCSFFNFRNYAIHLEGTVTRDSEFNFINNNHIENCSYGIYSNDFSYDDLIETNNIYWCNVTGIWLVGVGEGDVIGNSLWENGVGVQLYQSYYLRLIGNLIINNHYDGVYIQNSRDIIVSNNHIGGNSYLFNDTYSGVNLVAASGETVDSVEVSNNLIDGGDIQKYGVVEQGVGNLTNNTIKDNTIKNNVAGSIFYTNAIVKGNQGFATENSGTATVANNVWIPHGLATTPSVVTITSMNATYSNEPVIVSWINSNSTHFQVGVYWANGTAITNNVIGVSWHAEV